MTTELNRLNNKRWAHLTEVETEYFRIPILTNQNWSNQSLVRQLEVMPYMLIRMPMIYERYAGSATNKPQHCFGFNLHATASRMGMGGKTKYGGKYMIRSFNKFFLIENKLFGRKNN